VAGYRRGLRLRGSVVAVTGASSAIGRATALALVEHGAHPVLIARRRADLDDVVAACAGRGAAVLAVPVDVTVPDAVQEAARWAVARFGRLDGWVECAAAATSPALQGALLDVPLADLRHVFDVDVLGPVHGVRAALPVMIRQRHGVFVVVSSVHGQVAQPFGAAHSMALAAMRSMTAALRQELRLSGARGVTVAAVLAPSVETLDLHPGPAVRPVYPAERVAATVLRQLRRPRLEVVAGGPAAKALTHGHALVPGLTEWLVAEETRRARRVPAVTATSEEPTAAEPGAGATTPDRSED
jgi:NAD(P)-dependent dehydrogenase (short-subunit alcohol dehydrogenase family)